MTSLQLLSLRCTIVLPSSPLFLRTAESDLNIFAYHSKHTSIPEIQLLQCSVEPGDISNFRILIDRGHIKYLTIDATPYAIDDMCFEPSITENNAAHLLLFLVVFQWSRRFPAVPSW